VEESKLRVKDVSFTENMLAAACVGLDTDIGEEVDRKRSLSWVDDER
jgi:hypothetical protein